MRQKRVKSYRKVMQLYCAAFGFREPYQLLVDAAFLRACVQQKLDLYARLQDVLQGTVKPMITQCCIQALYDQGPEGQAAVDLAKEFERRKCNHFKPRPEEECIVSMCGESNPHRYVVATQSLDVRQQLRKVAGTPIVYIARSVVLLETPSDQTLAKKQSMENSKLHAPLAELALLSGKPLPRSKTTDDDDDEEEGSKSGDAAEGEGEQVVKKKKKQRGPKGPNPLSVPKKKKLPPPPPAKNLTEVQAGKKRAREEVERGQQDRKRRREENEKVLVTSLAARGGRAARGTAGTASGAGATATAARDGSSEGARSIVTTTTTTMDGDNGEVATDGKKKRKRRKKAKSDATAAEVAGTTATGSAD